MVKLNTKGGQRIMAGGVRKVEKWFNNFLSKYGTTTLMVIGVASCAKAVHEMYKAAEPIKEALKTVDEEVDESTTKLQKFGKQVKAVTPVAAPTMLWFTFGSSCIVWAHRADTKKVAALTTAYELSETARREYVNHVKDYVGEKKAKEIDDDYYQEQSQNNMPDGPKDRNICLTGKGDQLYYDEGSGRFFRSSPQWLEKCKVDISHVVFTDNYASVNDFYYILGIPAIELGNKAGWNTKDLDSDNLIDMRWDLRAGTADWGETYGFLSYESKGRFAF